ncbi:MAG: hypothetical protein RIC95_08135 [Vicingaceae bacterium]
MQNFTHFDFEKLSEEEAKLYSQIYPEQEKKDAKAPDLATKQAIDNILAYSKAISIRPSKQMNFIENVLN